jgi:hypothetical protein
LPIHHPTPPRGDGAFLAIQFPLSGKEMLLQFDGTTNMVTTFKGVLHKSTSEDQNYGKKQAQAVTGAE